MVSMLTVCLASVSAHSLPGGTKSRYIFQIVASPGYGENRAPSLEPRESHRGALGLPRTKSCQLARMKLSSHIVGLTSFPVGRRCCLSVTFSLLFSVRDQSPILHGNRHQLFKMLCTLTSQSLHCRHTCLICSPSNE